MRTQCPVAIQIITNAAEHTSDNASAGANRPQQPRENLKDDKEKKLCSSSQQPNNHWNWKDQH